MTLKKLTFKAGVNQENTRYTNENGWWETQWVRFRQGTPEKIGGFARISAATFIGVCRSLWNWASIYGANLLGVGTNSKFYVEQNGTYYDITPLRATGTYANIFTANTVTPSPVINVNIVGHNAQTGDFVTFSGALSLGGNIFALLLNANHRITYVDPNNFTITVGLSSTAADTGNGGPAITAAFEIRSGAATGATTRLWSQTNFGNDLILAYRDGVAGTSLYAGSPMYYWQYQGPSSLSARAVPLYTLPGAADVPDAQYFVFVSDVSRFVFAMGASPYGVGTFLIDPMLIRWSDQDSAVVWTPSATTQAGDVRLSHGSKIVTAIQTRQEIVVFTDSALYSMQYVGPPAVWQTQLLGDNISIVGPNAVALASGVVYWMGVDKFYKYDGRVQTLRCDLRQYIYNDINLAESAQFFASTNEGFNEIWFYYCSAAATTPDRYVIYNYTENNGEGVWYYGQNMPRSAWLDSGLRNYPMAATYSNNIVYQENGLDNNMTGTPASIPSWVYSTEFDIDDGDHFGFVWRILPDVTFRGSTTTSPTLTLTLIPMQNSGSGYNSPQSVAGSSYAGVTRTATAPIEQFTGQIYIRVRGRQMIIQFYNNQLGSAWQVGSPRIDIRQDGRRGS
jgi:hypothetical protein